MGDESEILIVDDNIFNIIAYQGVLNQIDIKADSASSGIIAFDNVKGKYERNGTAYKLILMDYSMQGLSGPETTEKILNFFNETATDVKRPYICCITAYKDKRFRKIALDAGMDDFKGKLTSLD